MLVVQKVTQTFMELWSVILSPVLDIGRCLLLV